MKSKILPFYILILLFLNGCVNTDPKKETAKAVMEKFMNPPNEFRTVPFWVWNEKVTEEVIDEQLEMYRENGFGGVFVHPRYGLITEYLSEEWNNLVEYAMNKAIELGMDLWFYDENSFPSGFAGGHVPDQMPESCNQGIGMVFQMEEFVNVKSQDDLLGVYKKENDQWLNISEKSSDYRNKKGEYVIITKSYFENSKWFGGKSYVDLMVPGVTKKFIEVTMKGYEKHMSDEFGKRVKGIFTDEPNISPRGNSLRWTPALFEEFEKMWGYKLEENLPSLFIETGNWKKIRHNYYSVLLNLFINNWSVPWKTYTDNNNLIWTGHYWEHGWPDPVHGGDNMAMYVYHQMPAIDLLFNNYKEQPDQFGNVRNVKELASIANQFGKNRTLCETYGASGYDLSFGDMKRNGDWMYSLGVNFMNQHLSYQSMLGDRKHDFPQTFSYHTSWWKEYRAHADYFARLSLALSSGQQENDILVLEPTTTAWMYNTKGSGEVMLENIELEFRKFIDWMEFNKYEYDLGSEKTIADFASASEGRFIIGQRSYKKLVIPPLMENIDKSTLKIVDDYLMSGGSLYIFGKGPEYVDGEKDTSWNKMIDKYESQVVKIEGLDSSFPEFKSEQINFPGDLSEAEGVYWMKRVMKDGVILFFANSDKGKEKSFPVECFKAKDIVELNPENGEILDKEHTLLADALSFRVNLSDAGSRMYFVSNRKIGVDRMKKKEFSEKELLDTYVSEIRRNEPNVLSIDYCKLKFPGDRDYGEKEYYYKVHDKIFQKHGFADNPWVSSSQFKTELVDRDTFPSGTGFSAAYSFFVHEGVDLSSLKAVVERPHLYELFLNGKKLKQKQGEWYLDKGNGVFSIAGEVKVGTNLFELKADPFSVYNELAPVFITGNFGLTASEQGFEIIPEQAINLGSWDSMGMPFYPGMISFTTNFVVADTDYSYLLSLDDFSASCVSVCVNNSDSHLLWPPYQENISDLLIEGDNRITVNLYSSLKNLIGPHHNNPRVGIVTPWSFKYAPEVQPSGKDYDFREYGLYSDVKIYKLKEK